jgi:hypothetical protein
MSTGRGRWRASARQHCPQCARRRQPLLGVGPHGGQALYRTVVARGRFRPCLEPRPGERILPSVGPQQRLSADAERPDQCRQGWAVRVPYLSAKIHGTYAGPWDLRITPTLRHQSGQPFGRTFSTGLNYANNVRILAEPIGTRRMDHITILDVRVEKGFRLGGHRRLAGFADVFNVVNANPEQNTSWSFGLFTLQDGRERPSFLRPLSIVPPRLARLGVKLDW